MVLAMTDPEQERAAREWLRVCCPHMIGDQAPSLANLIRDHSAQVFKEGQEAARTAADHALSVFGKTERKAARKMGKPGNREELGYRRFRNRSYAIEEARRVLRSLPLTERKP
jgi:hypothetical protein